MLQQMQTYIPFVESLCVILGVIFVAVQIRQQTKISRADHDRQKKQSTIEFYNALSSDSYQFLDEIKGMKITIEKVDADKPLRKSVIRYLSRLERLAVGTAADVYDFSILYLMSGRYLTKKYEQFQPYIEAARISTNAPMLYKEFEMLVKRFEEYKAINPDQVVDKKTRVQKP
jgi:hypothetical protein